METMKNAVIVKASIGIGDTGTLDINIVFDYGDCKQELCCEVHEPGSGINGKSYAGHFIYRILVIADVPTWAQLEGRAVRVKKDGIRIDAIGHIIDDTWLYTGKEFDQDASA
jgi:hypothetical protein